MTLFHFVKRFKFFIASIFILLVSTMSFVFAQTNSQWHARLSPNPIAFGTRNSITGSGEVNAVLNGHTLRLQGDFHGLQGKVTEVKLQQGPKAIPGPVLLDIKFSAQGDGRQGSMQSEIILTDEQLQALRNESLYIQLYSESAKEGNLRGWLLPLHSKN